MLALCLQLKLIQVLQLAWPKSGDAMLVCDANATWRSDQLGPATVDSTAQQFKPFLLANRVKLISRFPESSLLVVLRWNLLNWFEIEILEIKGIKSPRSYSPEVVRKLNWFIKSPTGMCEVICYVNFTQNEFPMSYWKHLCSSGPSLECHKFNQINMMELIITPVDFDQSHCQDSGVFVDNHEKPMPVEVDPQVVCYQTTFPINLNGRFTSPV